MYIVMTVTSHTSGTSGLFAAVGAADVDDDVESRHAQRAYREQFSETGDRQVSLHPEQPHRGREDDPAVSDPDPPDERADVETPGDATRGAPVGEVRDRQSALELNRPETEPDEREDAGDREDDVVSLRGTLHRANDIVDGRCLRRHQSSPVPKVN
jgi:hypothetical protein